MKKSYIIKSNGTFAVQKVGFEYAVFKRCDRFWQQATRAYLYKGWAIKRYNQLINTQSHGNIIN